MVPAVVAVRLRLPRLRPVGRGDLRCCRWWCRRSPSSPASARAALGRDYSPARRSRDFIAPDPGCPWCSCWSTWCWRCRSPTGRWTPGCARSPLRTLVEAARSLGASWPTVLLRVVVPNLRTAILARRVPHAGDGAGRVHHRQPAADFKTFAGLDRQAGSRTRASPPSPSRSLSLVVTWVLLLLIVRWSAARPPRRTGGPMTVDTLGSPPADGRARRPSSPRPAPPLRRDRRAGRARPRHRGRRAVALLGPSGCGKTTALRMRRRASRRPTPARCSWTARTSPRVPGATSATWAWCSSPTACSRT